MPTRLAATLVTAGFAMLLAGTTLLAPGRGGSLPQHVVASREPARGQIRLAAARLTPGLPDTVTRAAQGVVRRVVRREEGRDPALRAWRHGFVVLDDLTLGLGGTLLVAGAVLTARVRRRREVTDRLATMGGTTLLLFGVLPAAVGADHDPHAQWAHLTPAMLALSLLATVAGLAGVVESARDRLPLLRDRRRDDAGEHRAERPEVRRLPGSPAGAEGACAARAA